MPSTCFCIIRHGETAWNAARRMQGHLDIDLNEEGRRQAEATARHLAPMVFDAAYSSDLGRALQTAAPIAAALGLSLAPEPRLRERHYGVLQGLTYEEVVARYPEDGARIKGRDPEYDFRGGECLRDFAQRVEAAVDELAVAHRGGRVLLVSHGGVLDVIYRRAVGRDLRSPRNFPIPNAGINWVEVGPAGWRLLDWARQEHLSASRDELAG